MMAHKDYESDNNQNVEEEFRRLLVQIADENDDVFKALVDK